MSTPDDVGIWRRVSTAMYLDAKYLALSPMQPSGRSLWLHLITGPHVGLIPGLSRIGRMAMAEELEWLPERFDEAFREVFAQGLAKADWEARVVWLPKALRHNPPANPNIVKSWRKFWSGIPHCPLKGEAYEGLRAGLAERGSRFEAAFVDHCPNPYPNGFANNSPNRTPNHTPNQRTESRETLPSQEGGKSPSLSDGSPAQPPSGNEADEF